jgi:DNA polymerase III delta prime subunit
MPLEDYSWSEKYRPKRVADCILPDRIKDIFLSHISNGQLNQHLLLNGGPGIGKTSIAKAVVDELNADLLFINASIDCNIDTLRTKITNFASSVSFSQQPKIVILDEADGLNPQSFQPALKAFMEEFSSNCKFILTSNLKSKLIEPIHSRCAVIDFDLTKEEAALIQVAFWKRLCEILDKEGIAFEKPVLAKVVSKFYPDFRKTINELQRYSCNGEINTGILSAMGDVKISELIGYLKNKEFTDMRKWVAQNVNMNSAIIFRRIYDSLYDVLEPSSIPQAVLIIADYQYKAAFCADLEINLVACCTELMGECSFK